ncbi:hypothetical protein NBRC116583_11610 [Arenicella sp. 4NH20-0111]
MSEKKPKCPDCHQILKVEGLYVSIFFTSFLAIVFTAMTSFSENIFLVYLSLNLFGYILSSYLSFKLFVRLKAEEKESDPN